MKKAKYFLVFASLIMFFSSVGSPIVLGATEMDYEQRLKQMKEAFEFIGEHAVLTDEYGNIIGFDFDKIRERYAEDEGLNLLEKEINEARESHSGAWFECMKSALMDHFGVSTFQAMIDAGILTYIKQKLWKEAAKIAVKFFVKLSIGGIVATLIYYSGKCAIWGIKGENKIEDRDYAYS
ncbi:hypothetical protein M5W68_17480 [Paenibacillus larvae]|uniref:hypothetical protein n=1 Tax=Paenibacillus larvae TaxID=1464 RepID=UPI00228116A3|nr:hypothetical protein [Paenibacillus larvae]MCY9511819.1 hypothetical protein [Paenibacillus larvae]MCY9526851.1 hypothetical protein [Paenibacillus larvae]